jgi:hypothetical protein
MGLSRISYLVSLRTRPFRVLGSPPVSNTARANPKRNQKNFRLIGGMFSERRRPPPICSIRDRHFFCHLFLHRILPQDLCLRGSVVEEGILQERMEHPRLFHADAHVCRHPPVAKCEFTTTPSPDGFLSPNPTTIQTRFSQPVRLRCFSTSRLITAICQGGDLEWIFLPSREDYTAGHVAFEIQRPKDGAP